MKRPAFISLTVFLLFFIMMFVIPSFALAGKSKIKYAAAFTCGANPVANVRILPGHYATAVNIHNPSTRTVTLNMRIALTFPPPTLNPGQVSETIEVELPYNQALQVDCQEIPSTFLPDFSGPPYVQGFLIIESKQRLDVTAVYTTGTAEAVQSIDVKEIFGNRDIFSRFFR